tara:strand:- start:2069 stop:2479 length:411 start_codon:yes stop_codon:yes gene_type:complete
MEQSRKIELLKNYLDIEITHDVNDFDNVDCHIYNDSSADGYDLYIVTNDTRNPTICEDVYYYDHDLVDRFEDQVRWGDKTFYICEYVYEDSYFEDKLEEMFVEKVEEIIEDFEGTEEELKYLKEEYGIEDEETTEA